MTKIDTAQNMTKTAPWLPPPELGVASRPGMPVAGLTDGIEVLLNRLRAARTTHGFTMEELTLYLAVGQIALGKIMFSTRLDR